MPNAFTFGQVKNAIAYAYDGGLSADDARIMPVTNQAIDYLIRNAVKVNPRGLFVGGVDVLPLAVQASIGSLTGKLVVLPVTHDTVLQAEILNAGDITNGWYNILDLSGLVNPDMQQDTIFIDRGETSPGGTRVYDIPDAAIGNTVKVTAIKRFTPITSDADIIPIRSLEALKAAVKVIQYRGQVNDPEKANAYEQIALGELKADLDRYMLDSTQSLVRKQAYLNDEKTYGGDSLGYVRARLALDVQGGQMVGKTIITRSINRAVERLLQHRNEIRTTGRLSVKTGLNTVVFSPVTAAANTLQISDYEQIRCMIRSFKEDGDSAGWEAKAYKLMEDEELNALETHRHTDYSTSLVSVSQFSVSWYAYKWGLDAPMGLMYSDVELKRLVTTAAEFIYQEKYNYQLVERNRIKTSVPTLSTVPGSDAVALSDVIPYREMKLAMDSFAYQGDPVNKALNPQAASLQDGVKAMLKERLEAELESLRHTTYATTLQTIIQANGIATLGYVFNKLQLEMPGGIRISDVEMRRVVNEAVREAVQRRNELSVTEEYTNLVGPDVLPFTYTTNDNAVLPYSEYEVLRLLVMAQLPGGDAGLKAEAFSRIEASLRKSTIAIRNSNWHCLLQSNPFPQFGGTRAQIGLEYADGFKMNDGKVFRYAAQAWQHAASTWNNFTRQEDNEADQRIVPSPILDTSVIPFPLETIKLYAEAQMQRDAGNKGLADGYEAQANDSVARDLKTELETARRKLWEGNLSLPRWSFGWIKAKVGLGLMEKGFQFPDSKLARMVNDAEDTLAKSTNFVNDEADIVCSVDSNGLLSLPSDCTRIIYSDICGIPLRNYSRSFDYLGYPAGHAFRANSYPFWGFGNGWGWSGRAKLIDAGYDADGNRQYTYAGCWQSGTQVDGNVTLATTIRIVAKRKHVKRFNDTDLMLVQDLLAIRCAVESEIARLDKDLNGANALMAQAVGALDQSLSNEQGSEITPLRVSIAGNRRVTRNGLAGNFGRSGGREWW